MITISEEAVISELGRRSNNEDNAGTLKGVSYVVCDGVGGAEKGEVASQIVVQSYLDAYTSSECELSASHVLNHAENRLSDFLARNPEATGMATTLSFAHIRKSGVYVAWVGDSRVYQFRGGQIRFKTKDHSWVNEAVAAGIITEQEAVGHPKSNVITRAVQGTHKPAQVDEAFVGDVQKDDYFMLCSDGVLETWSDDDFSALFGDGKTTEEIIRSIQSECASNSKDNSTAIVFRIGSVLIENTPESTNPLVKASTEIPVVEAIPLLDEQVVEQVQPKRENISLPSATRPISHNTVQPRPLLTIQKKIVILIGALVLIILLALLLRDDSKNSQPNRQVRVKTTGKPEGKTTSTGIVGKPNNDTDKKTPETKNGNTKPVIPVKDESISPDENKSGKRTDPEESKIKPNDIKSGTEGALKK